MKHMFKPGEKEAVASLLGIPVEEMPDVLNLGNDEDEEEDDDEETNDDEDEDESEEDDDEDETSSEDEEDEDEDEDEDAEESESDVELLNLKQEWQRDFSQNMPFSEFLKIRGK